MKSNHPYLKFNSKIATQSTTQKHLGVVFDFKLNFKEHFKDQLSKINKSTELFGRSQKILPRLPLLTIRSLLLDPTLTMATFYMTKYTLPHFMNKIRENSVRFSACKNKSYKRNKQKSFRRFRIKISLKNTLVSKTLLFYEIFDKQSPEYLLNITLASNRL